MGTTARAVLPYPDLPNTPDVPRDIKALADRVAVVLGSPTYTSSTRPAPAFEGQLIFESDTGKVMRWNGTAWLCIQATQWVSFTPTWRSAGTSLLIGNGALSGYYKHVGDQVTVRIELLRGTTSNVGANSYTWDLPTPSPAATYAQAVGTGIVLQSSGAMTGYYAMMPNATTLALNSTTSNARLAYNSFTWGDGDRILIEGSYRAASIA